MKNIFTACAILSLITLGCKKKAVSDNPSPAENKEVSISTAFAVDSVKVEDSSKLDKNLTAVFRTKILLFPELNNRNLLDSIYSPTDLELSAYTKPEIEKAVRIKISDFYQNQKTVLKDYKPEFHQNWESNSSMKLISNTNDYLTLQYTGDGYTGGAHGYYYELYRVFDLKAGKTVQLTDVVTNIESTVWDNILMDNFVQNDGDKGQVEMLLVKKIPLNSNFYFDREYLYFLYNEYEITAYAAGTVLIRVPLSDIKPFLTDSFKKRQGL